jgi:hypothetical protein
LIDSVIDFAKEYKVSKVWLNTNTKLKVAMSLNSIKGFIDCGNFNKHFWIDKVKFYELLLK